jgi:hypothetical protein
MQAAERARDILTVIFLAATVTSAGVAGVFTYHYTQFFPSMKQLQLDISSFSFNPTNISLNGLVVFAVRNPSSYSGVSMTDFVTNYTIQAPGNFILPQGVVNYLVRPASLDPQNNVTLKIPLIGSLNGPYRVYQLLSTYPTSQFRFNFTATVFVSTFLQSYATLQAVYDCTTTINSGTCAQAGVLLKTHPGAGTSAGGS